MAKKATTKKKNTRPKALEPVWAAVYKTEQDVWIDLLANGFIRGEVHFSGGNDEGGVDLILLKKVGAKEDEQAIKIDGNDVYNSASPFCRIARALASPVHYEYGSFAGEFNVNGVVVWDCTCNEIRIEGTEETTQYEDFTRKIVNWQPETEE